MSLRLIAAHVLDGLAQLADESVHCVVTSPPYYGLRSYGTQPQVWGGDPECEHAWGSEQTISRSGGTGKSTLSRHPDQANQARAVGAQTVYASQGAFCRCGAWRGDLGLEPTVELYIAHLVEVFGAVRRVLRQDGTLWLNIGDSYASGGPSGGGSPVDKRNPELDRRKRTSMAYDTPKGRKDIRYLGLPKGTKPKDLLMIPAQLALALRADGWWLRSEIVWAKKAPMPESATDRPTCAHEKVFLLTKAARYYFDQEAVKEDGSNDSHGGTPIEGGREQAALGQQIGGAMGIPAGANKRNMRNWWLLGPEPFPEAHFAVFPTEIPRRAIKAGTSERGVCPKCGAPWCRVVEKTGQLGQSWHNHEADEMRGQRGGASGYKGEDRKLYESMTVDTIGWRPSCFCYGEIDGTESSRNRSSEETRRRETSQQTCSSKIAAEVETEYSASRGESYLECGSNADRMLSLGSSVIPATVLDPFLGSGTTALVADRLQRHCIGIELAPSYAAMSERRLRDDAGMFLELAADVAG